MPFNTATRHLANQVDANILTRVGRGRATRYEPTENALTVYQSALPNNADAEQPDQDEPNRYQPSLL